MVDRLASSEPTGRWPRHILEYEGEQVRKANPIPAVGGPGLDENRQARVPSHIEEYLRRRYGPDVSVAILSPHGEPDGSGYSYRVYSGEAPIADMVATRAIILMLPPGCEGHLKKEYDAVQERNRRLPPGSKPEELIRTLWEVGESAQAAQMHAQMLQPQPAQ